MITKTAVSKEGSAERRILIVDDDQDFSESLGAVLDLHGYATHVVHTENDALKAVETFDPHVALLDMRLGKSNGIDLIPRIQKKRPGTICLMITGFGTIDTAIQALKEGAYDFFRKPVNPPELLATLDRSFEKILLEKAKADAEKTLVESAERFRAVVETAGDAIITIDMQGIIEMFNPAAERIFGFSRSEVIGQNVSMLMPKPDNSGHDEYLQKYMRTGQANIIGSGREVTGQRKDGSIFPLDLAVSEMALSEGKMFVGILRDISERKRAEEEILESKKRFQSIFDHSNDMIFILNPAGDEILDVNFKACSSLGYSREELLSLRISSLHPHEMSKLLEFFQSTSEKGGGWTDEMFCRTKTGKFLPAEISAAPIDIGGRSYVVASVRNITERKRAELELKEAEARYEDLYNNAPDMFASVEASTARVVQCNQTLVDELGYSKEDIVGKLIYDLYHPDCHGEAQKAFHSFLETGEIRDVELQLRRKDGSKKDVSLSVSAIRDESGKILHSRSVWRDITARKRAEEELRKSHEQLRQLAGYLQSAQEDERASLAREIHDELGQALTVLKMNLAWVGDRLAPDQKSLHDKTESMSTMVESVLEAMRSIASGLRPGLLDDLGLASAIEWHVGDIQKRTGIKFCLNRIPEDIPLDRDQSTAIFRIYQEAVTNALRYAKASRIAVMLNNEGQYVTLEVTDDGKGITEDQISGSKSMGLVGMRERAFLLGGEVKISGHPGKGTTVAVRIPIQKPASQESDK